MNLSEESAATIGGAEGSTSPSHELTVFYDHFARKDGHHRIAGALETFPYREVRVGTQVVRRQLLP